MPLNAKWFERLRSRFVQVRVWLIPAALLALTPKCILCLAAYAGIGAALGLGGPEICGAAQSSTMKLWMASFVLSGAALSVVGLYVRHRITTKTFKNRQSRQELG
jgi:hypothetical protein